MQKVAERRIVHQSDNIRLIALDAGWDDVVVTFNDIWMAADGDRFWGDQLLKTLPVAAFGIMTPRPNWYPIDEMLEAIAILNALIGGRRVVTYGNRQGGYGALKFAQGLGASAALAFSPQWSIDPEDVAKFDRRYVSNHAPALKNGSRITAEDICSRSFVFYDPRQKADAQHVRHLAEIPGVMPIVVPFTLNDTIRVVQEGQAAPAMIDLVRRSEAVTAGELRNLVRAARSKSETYRTVKSTTLLTRMKSASVFLERHLAAAPESPKKQVMLACYHARRGDTDLALSILAGVSDKELMELSLPECLAWLRQGNFKAGELRVAALIKVKHPDSWQPRLNAVRSYINCDEPEKAAAELAEILDLPGAYSTPAAAEEVFAVCERSLDLAASESYLMRAFQLPGFPIPTRVRLHLRLIDAYIAKKMRRDAFRNLHDLTEACQKHFSFYKGIAERYLTINEAMAALELYRQLTEQSPGDTDLRMLLIRALIRIDHDEGTKELDTLVQAGNLSAEAFELAARLYRSRGLTPQAVDAARKAVSLAPDKLQYRVGLINLLLFLGQPKAATTELMNLPPGSAEGTQWDLRRDPLQTMEIAKALARAGHRDQAIEIMEKLASSLEEGLKLEARHFILMARLCRTNLRSAPLGARVLDIAVSRFPTHRTVLEAAQRAYSARTGADGGGAGSPITGVSIRGFLAGLLRWRPRSR
jgi:tetratricopeptide (TPR) repeat protein